MYALSGGTNQTIKTRKKSCNKRIIVFCLLCSLDISNSYGATSNAFIFSLRNSENLPPFKTLVSIPAQAILKRESNGPTFGPDLFVDLNHPKKPAWSHSNLGHSYVPTVAQGKLKTVLAGSYIFVLHEVEVFFLA